MYTFVTAVVNNPVFIIIQHSTLSRFVKGEYKFIVFNDAKDFPDRSNGGDTNIRQQIRTICSNLNIECIDIPNEKHRLISNPIDRCADSMNYILEYQKNNKEKYFLLDSDMFLIDYFDINTFNDYDCAIILQTRDDPLNVGEIINYCWNGLYYFDFTRIKNIDLLDWYYCKGTDVGGKMRYWLNEQTNVFPTCEAIRNSVVPGIFNRDSIYYIKHLWSGTWDETEYPKNIQIDGLLDFLKNDPRNTNNKFFCEIYHDKFLHYRAGGNWMGQGMELHKMLSFKLLKLLKK
jgi:hypothetical protein